MIGNGIGRNGYRGDRPLGDVVPIDRDRVARLRRAIAAGTYRLDPDGVAAAMVTADLPSPTKLK